MGKPDYLYLEVNHWIVLKAANWTPQQAEDRMDALRKATRDLVRRVQANQPQWTSLSYDGRATERSIFVEGGKTFLHYACTLKAAVNREADPAVVRKAFGVLMQGAFAELSQGIYDYQRPLEDFGTKSPISYVASAGDDFSSGLTF